ncbi:SCY1 protein kinase [Spizellomyces punctatus DAOM BR117]|uniref:SCY1 protein kinase n=1 Tax=Spizellomyces punctatus (strain DAOM BR117) TaxID=645134 RepID=A0A0L0HR96_SPIPD|nr:SCY1 protein kinase [Spizellomyces punctatus DAOM BR117]KND03592.1 SCY1 protein kinase [Spizellomyces punctatus DAOM BR117]|eukprot:XP_016611631.1 SCY1 protein kinase [Spizellomyces punctatus DAOM BR117]
MFEFAKSALTGALGSKGPSLPFTVGEVVHSDALWTIHDGSKKDDRTPVSVFVFDSVRHRDKLPLARNALKKCRTIRHPDMLKVIEGVETETKIIIGTEAVTPLRTYSPLKSLNQNLIAWGLYKIATAIKFLNTDCNMIHGNIRVDSIYTTKAGEWKLGGFELLSSLKEDNPVILTYGGYLPEASKYAPPEVRKTSWTACRNTPSNAVDSWAFGCLIHEIFNGFFSRPEDLGQRGDIPQELFPIYKSFLNMEPKARMTMGDFLDKGIWKQGYFDKDFISVTLFLEQIAIKDAFEKEQFIRKIDASLESFPLEFCKYKILPELIQAVEYGGAGAKALTPILKLGGKLDQQEFDNLVVPIVIKLFASSDRAIRVSLCEGLPNFINNLNSKTVSDKIFPNLAIGFMDSSAVIRECTLKSVLVIIGKLNERITNNDLLRYLAKLQQDEEPGIRTNTTICLGKISKHLNDATKKRVLVPAFLRSFNDPFAPARTAGLVALAATVEFYDGQDCAQRIIPTLAPLLLDPEKQVRRQAFNNMEIFVKKLEKIADNMPETSVPAGTVANGGPGASQPPGASTEGWANWAISAVSTKLGTSLTPNGSSTDLTKTPPTTTKPAPTTASSTPLNPSIATQARNMAPSVAMAPLVPVSAPNGWDVGAAGWGWDTESDLPPVTKTVSQPSSSKGVGSAFSIKAAKATENWAEWGDNFDPIPSSKPNRSTAQPTTSLVSSGENAWTENWGGDGWDIDPLTPSRPLSSNSIGSPGGSAEDKERRRQRLAEQREARKAGKLGARKI